MSRKRRTPHTEDGEGDKPGNNQRNNRAKKVRSYRSASNIGERSSIERERSEATLGQVVEGKEQTQAIL